MVLVWYARRQPETISAKSRTYCYASHRTDNLEPSFFITALYKKERLVLIKCPSACLQYSSVKRDHVRLEVGRDIASNCYVERFSRHWASLTMLVRIAQVRRVI